MPRKTPPTMCRDRETWFVVKIYCRDNKTITYKSVVEHGSGNVLSLCPNSLGTIRWLCRSGLSSVNISKLLRRSVNNCPLQIDNHYWLSQQQESFISFYTKSGTTVCLCVNVKTLVCLFLYLMWPSWNDHLFFSYLFISYSFFYSDLSFELHSSFLSLNKYIWG